MDTYFVPHMTVHVCSSLWDRMRGVIGRENLLCDGVCVLKRCNWVHTFFLRTYIHVYFISSNKSILAHSQLSPFRLSPLVIGGRHTIESARALSSDEITQILSVISD